MNPNTPPPSDDDLPDEQALAALYARLPRAEPDPALDAAVLAAAARATVPRRRPRWPVALGSAAVLVLAVGMAWQLRQSAPAPIAYTPAVPASPSEDVAAPPPPAPPPIEMPAAQETVQKASPAAARRVAPTVHAQVRKVVRAAPPPLEQPAPMIMAAPAEPAPVAAPPAPPAPPSPPASLTPPVPGEVRTYVAAPSLKLDSAPAARENAAYAPSGAVATPAPMTSAPTLDPDTRVAEIRRLLGEGRRDEALRELKTLRREHPRYELPQDLRDLER
ncbi:MAG: hypothetical protein GAK28_02959 [Luteibacter sp.]|uniref:hypothetical protein n=1 Tax=Luteibacter sp. TaxID=1886636 RepID=UPI0013812CF1|nr:hypothetical protein [Luteibacter sp.]KAF1005744.1 MAG: hypothetical protein GAK28_02959 [Luteibacter sp.]